MKHSLVTKQQLTGIREGIPVSGNALKHLHGFVFRTAILAGVLIIVVAALVTSSAARTHNDSSSIRKNESPAQSSVQATDPTPQSSQEATPMNNATPNNAVPSSDNQSSHSQSVSSSVSSTTINGQTSTSVMVNGQNVPVPSNGELHRTIPGPNGTTHVDISNNSSGQQSGSSSASSSVQIDVRSSNAP